MFLDVNALYPATLLGYLPHSKFTLHDKEDSAVELDLIKDMLLATNVDFFHEELTRHNQGYHLKVEMKYDLDLLRNLDLAHFPIRRTIDTEDLSSQQQRTAVRYKRNISREPAKLVSESPQKPFIYSDFVENILYLILFNGAQITNVLEMIMFKSYPYMKDYSKFLQRERGKTSSKIVGKLLKNLGNNIPGRMHMDSNKFTDIKISNDLNSFRKFTEDPRFFNLIRVNQSTAIFIFDGKTTICDNPIYVPAKVYSTSKQYIWKSYLMLGTRLAKYALSNSRLCLTDTDSLLISSQRQRSRFEEQEIRQLLQTNTKIPFHQSRTGKFLGHSLIKVFGDVLDYSSIDKNSLIFKTVVEGDLGLEAMFKILQKRTKNTPFLYKDEVNEKLISDLFSPSPKQYYIETTKNNSFPNPDEEKQLETQNIIKKAKGIKRSLIQKRLVKSDFLNSMTESEKTPLNKIRQYTIKRKNRRLFISYVDKKKLSNLCTKRLFPESLRSKNYFWSLPLNCRPHISEQE